MKQPPLAIVTGAGSGIGRAVATELAKEKWTVIVNDLDESAAQKTSELIHQLGGECTVIVADVGDEGAVNDLFKCIENTYEHSPSLLINNAAIQTWASLTELTVEQWQKTLSTNLTGSTSVSESHRLHRKQRRY